MKFHLPLYTLIFTLAAISFSIYTANAQQFTTVDIVKVKASYEKEAMFFYNENWKQFRIEAHQRGFISGFELLKTEIDSLRQFQLILITKYPDSISFHQKEENFAPIMKRISPNGPKMLNSVPRKEILEWVAGYEAILIEHAYLYSNENDQPKKEIEKIHNAYINSWVKMDEASLMNLFDDNASIQPNTLKPIIGKENIRAFWFPKDGSKTIIHSFTTKIINFSIVDDLAISTHSSFLDYTYEKGTTVIKRKQKAINTTLYKKQPNKTWKIWKSMWADYAIE